MRARKTLALLLALLMLVGLLPMSALAAVDVQVADQAQLESVLTLGGKATLTSDIHLTKPLDVTNEVTIDLNGHVITDGTIVSTGSPNYNDYLIAVRRGGNLTIEDNSADKTGKIISTNSDIKCAVKMTTYQDFGSEAATLIVNGGLIQGYCYGISGNGTRHGTNITINGGTIKGYKADDNTGIYHPQDGTLTVNGGTISGYSAAIEIRSGTLVINNGTFTADALAYTSEKNGNGSTTKGAAIAVVQHTTEIAIDVTINGGTFTGARAFSEDDPHEQTPKNITLALTGGTFIGPVESSDVEGFISGGKYSAEPDSEYFAEGLVGEQGEDGKWTPVKGTFKIDDKTSGTAGGTLTVTGATVMEKTESADVYATYTAEYEAAVTLTVAPEEGYELVNLWVDGKNHASEVSADGQYTFSMVGHNTTMRADFSLIEYHVRLHLPDRVHVGDGVLNVTTGDVSFSTMPTVEGKTFSYWQTDGGAFRVDKNEAGNQCTFNCAAAFPYITVEEDGKYLDLYPVYDDAVQTVTLHTKDADVYITAADADTTVTKTYGEDDNTYVYSVTYGQQFTLPELEKDGYTFGGWIVNEESEPVTGTSVTVTSDLEYNAKWTKDSFKLMIYLTDADTVEAEQIKTGSKPYYYDTGIKTIDTEATSTGRTFSFWTTKNGFTVTEKNAEGKYYFTCADAFGHFTEIDGQNYLVLYPAFDANTYSLTLNANGGTYENADDYTEYTYGVVKTLPTDVTKNGYTFEGWYTENEGGSKITQIAATWYGPQTYYAHWTPVTFKLYFKDARETAPTEWASNSSYTVEAGTVEISTRGEKAGKTFLGWTDGTNRYMVDEDNKLSIDTTVAVNYVKEVEGQTVKCLVLEPIWDDVELKVTLNTGAADVYITDADVTETVTYGENNNTYVYEVVYGSDFTLPELTREGYTLQGWYLVDDDTTAYTTYTVTNDTAFTANWTEIKYKVAYYPNITGEETPTFSPEHAYLAEFSIWNPTSNSKFNNEGHTFSGWNTAADGTGTPYAAGDKVSKLTEDATFPLYAMWDVTYVTITCYANYPDADPATIELTVPQSGKGITAPEITREGYTLAGWYKDADCTGKLDLTGLVHKDRSIYAKWTPNKYDVTVVYGNGDASKTLNREYNSTINLSTPSWTGHTFSGWQSTYYDRLFVPGTDTYYVPAAPDTLTAQWDIETYTVTFNANGGKIGKEETTTATVAYGAYATLPDATRAGYTLAGWTAGSDTVYTATNPYTVKSDVTLTAKWNLNTYYIIYDDTSLYGGKVPDDAPKTFTAETDATLVGATNSNKGIEFNEWRLEDGTPVKKLGASNIPETGDSVTVYAAWKFAKFTVTYDGNLPYKAAADAEVNFSAENKTVTYNNPYGTLATASLTGFTFNGWSLTPDGSSPIVESGDEATIVKTAKNHAVYAIWTDADATAPVVTVAVTNSPVAYGYAENAAPTLTATITNKDEETYTYAYAWYENGVSTAIADADAAIYKPMGLTAGEHKYYCVVTATVKGTTKTLSGQSDPATVTVEKAQLSVEWNIWSPEYNGKEQKVAQIKVTPAVAKDSIHILVDSSDKTLKDNGDGSYYITLRDVKVDESLRESPYKVQYLVAETSNYFPKNIMPEEVTITPKEVTIEWKSTQESGSFNYPYAGGATVTGAIPVIGNIQANEEGKLDTVAYTITGDTAKIPGNYTAKVTKLENTNYKLPASTEKAWNINYQQSSYKVEAKDLTYNGKEQELVTPTLTGCTIKYNEVGGKDGYYSTPIKKTNAGTYTVYYELTADTYYEIIPEANRYGSVQVTIKKADYATNVVIPEKWTYGDTPNAPTVEVKENGTVTYKYQKKGETAYITDFDASKAGVGEYIVYAEVTQPEGSNYNNPTVTPAEFVITQREVTLTWSTDTLIYNGQNQAPTAKAGNLANGDDVNVEVTVSVEHKDAATPYTAVASRLYITGADTAPNYKLPAAKTHEYTIGAKAITVNALGATIKYGDDAANAGVVYVLDGDVVTKPADLDASGLTFTYVDLNGKTYAAGDPAGNNYRIIPSGISDTNYAVTYGRGVLTVEPKPITVTGLSNAKVAYTGKAQAPVATLEGVLDEDQGKVFAIANNGWTDAGKYTAAFGPAYGLGGEAKDNYVLAEAYSSAFEIEPITLSLTWGTTTEFPYNGKDQSMSYTISGDTVGNATWTVTDGTKKDVGKYTCTVALTNSNYVFAANTQTAQAWEIEAKTLIIKAQDMTVTYGDPVPTYYAVYDGFVEGEAYDTAERVDDSYLFFTCDYTPTSAVRTYTITPGTVDYKNYTEQFQTGTLTVNQKALTVSWDSKAAEVTYDGKAHAPVAIVEGYIVGDDVHWTVSQIGEHSGNTYNNRTYVKNLDGTRENDIVYRDWTIELTGTSAGNYALPENYEKGTLTIKPLIIGVVWDKKEFTYSGAAQAPTGSLPQVVAADAGNVSITGYTITANEGSTLNSEGKAVDAGSYKIKATGLSGSRAYNYDLSTAAENNSTDFAIAAYVITADAISFSQDSATYTGEDQKPIVTVKVKPGAEEKTLEEGKDYTVAFTKDGTVATEIKDAGTYDATFTSKNGNYVFAENIKKAFIINPYEIGADAIAFQETATYNGEAQYPTVTVKVKPGTEEVTLVRGNDKDYRIAFTKDGTEIKTKADIKDAGTYDATFICVNGNYVFAEDIEKAFTINPYEIGADAIAFQETATYNGEAQYPTVTVTVDPGAGEVELIRDTDYRIAFTKDGTKINTKADIKNVGAYVATFISKNINFTFANGITKTFTIQPKPITITMDNQTAVYGAAAPEFTYTVSADAMAGSDTITVTPVVPGEGHVDDYDITCTYVITEDANNYTVTVVKGTYSITKAQPVLTNPDSNNQTATTASGLALVKEGTLSDLAKSNDLKFQYSVDGGANYTDAIPKSDTDATKTYTVKWKVDGGNDFYTVEGDVSTKITKQNSGGTGGGGTGGGSTGGVSSSGSGLSMELIAQPNGTINFPGKEPTEKSMPVNKDTTYKVEVKANANYKIDTVTYTTAPNYDNPKEATLVSEGVYEIAVTNASIQVTATFKAINENDPSVGKVTIENYTNTYATCDHTEANCLLATFDDLRENLNAWYHDGIHYCLENGIMQGFGTPYFLPDGLTTRAQVVTTLWNIAGHPIATSDVVFDDVHYGDWYYDAIMWAAANHIVDGYGDGKFGPNDLITHEQLAKIFYGYAAFYGFDVTPTADISGMPGANTVHDWALPYVQWGVATKLCCGVNGNVSLIAATENVTRAELATTILNFCTNVATKPAKTA